MSVTTRAGFAADEWDLVVRLPRWIVAAASAAQQDLRYRTNIEVEAGFIAAADGREIGNAFVTEVALQTMRVYDDRSNLHTIEFDDRETGIKSVLERVRVVNTLLKEKVEVGDAMAYRRWLLTITDVVISAARSGDFLGFGGTMVTACRTALPRPAGPGPAELRGGERAQLHQRGVESPGPGAALGGRGRERGRTADNSQRTHAEREAGFIAVAGGRELGSVVVRDVAQACMAIFDQMPDVSFTDPEAGLAQVLEQIRAAAQLVRAKSTADDAAAYRRWLINVTDVVINAARSGDKLGFGGVTVTPAEKKFRDQVVLAVQA